MFLTKWLEQRSRRKSLDDLGSSLRELERVASNFNEGRFNDYRRNHSKISAGLMTLSGTIESYDFKDTASARAVLTQGYLFTRLEEKEYVIEDSEWHVERPAMSTAFLRDNERLLKKAFQYLVAKEGLEDSLLWIWPKDFYFDDIKKEMQKLLDQNKPVEFFRCLDELVNNQNDREIKIIFSMDCKEMIFRALDLLLEKNPQEFLFGIDSSYCIINIFKDIDSPIVQDYLDARTDQIAEAAKSIDTKSLNTKKLKFFEEIFGQYMEGGLAEGLRSVYRDYLKAWIGASFAKATLSPLSAEGHKVIMSAIGIADYPQQGEQRLISSWSASSEWGPAQSMGDFARDDMSFLLLRHPQETGEGNRLAEIWAVVHQDSVVGVSRTESDMTSFLSTYQANGFQRLNPSESFSRFLNHT